MSAGALRELVDERTIMMPLKVEQYHRMIEQGILSEGEPFELLDGYLVRKDRSARGEDPITVGSEHVWVVQKLGRLSGKLERLGCRMRTQSPISFPPYQEPEPDGAVVVGDEDRYREQHPGPADVTCVIEVADSSLRRDRTSKQRIYADAGIARYLIINLPDRVVEVYTEPQVGKGRYGRVATLSGRSPVEFPAARGRRLSVPVRTLLPR